MRMLSSMRSADRSHIPIVHRMAFRNAQHNIVVDKKKEELLLLQTAGAEAGMKALLALPLLRNPVVLCSKEKVGMITYLALRTQAKITTAIKPIEAHGCC